MSGAIGIVGGVGPYAGLDLMRKIMDQTTAGCDQDHLPILHFCCPNRIVDRTQFLAGKTDVNPGVALGEIMAELAEAGATVIGVPCNTAHSPAILDVALARLAATGKPVTFVHMIDAVAAHIRHTMPQVQRVGVLGTIGTWQAGIYPHALTRAGIEALFPDEQGRARVQSAISDPQFGIKAKSSPVTEQARTLLAEEARALTQAGAQAVILGCTEIPLALTEPTLHGVPLLDATFVLGTALIAAYKKCAA